MVDLGDFHAPAFFQRIDAVGELEDERCCQQSMVRPQRRDLKGWANPPRSSAETGIFRSEKGLSLKQFQGGQGTPPVFRTRKKVAVSAMCI
jgi:hypothetical protein